MRTAKEILGKDMAKKLFARLDGDRDGRLSKEEIEADLENGEGVLGPVDVHLDAMMAAARFMVARKLPSVLS